MSEPFREYHQYSKVDIGNEMKTLVVNPHDESSYSYLAVSVGVGSQSDPPEFLGFTHLIEHLLFTGSKNYDKEHYMNDLINKHHGSYNGCTESFTTNYYFKIEKL